MNEIQKSDDFGTTKSSKTETVTHKRENALIQSKIDQYSLVVENIEQQIKETNRTKQRETGMVAGIDDFIGEKTKLYETGSVISARNIEQSVGQAKKLHAKILADFQRKNLSPSEKTKIDDIITRLEKISGSKLEHVSWWKAIFNSLNIEDTQWDLESLKNRAKIGARAVIGLAEGGYEGITGIMEITGKAIGILGAYSFAPETRDIIKDDITNILTQLTLENAKKVVAMLPKVLDEFSKLPPEKQSEGASKLIGMILVPLGIGAKGVQAGKALAESGIATTKMGIETTTRAAQIVAKQANRAYGVSQRALKVAGKAGATGLATAALGTGGTTLAWAAVAGGSAVRFIGEMGSGGKEKVVTRATEKATLQEKIAKAEARSRVPYETVLRNSNLPEPDRFALAATLIGHELTPAQQVAIRSIHNDISKWVYQNGQKELRVMVKELDKVGITRTEGRKLMENGVLWNGDALLAILDTPLSGSVLNKMFTPWLDLEMKKKAWESFWKYLKEWGENTPLTNGDIEFLDKVMTDTSVLWEWAVSSLWSYRERLPAGYMDQFLKTKIFEIAPKARGFYLFNTSLSKFPEDTLFKIAHSWSKQDQMVLATRLTTVPDNLIDRNYMILAYTLAKSSHPDIRAKVAQFVSGEWKVINFKNTSFTEKGLKEIILDLASDSHSDVRAVIAKNIVWLEKNGLWDVMKEIKNWARAEIRTKFGWILQDESLIIKQQLAYFSNVPNMWIDKIYPSIKQYYPLMQNEIDTFWRKFQYLTSKKPDDFMEQDFIDLLQLESDFYKITDIIVNKVNIQELTERFNRLRYTFSEFLQKVNSTRKSLYET